MQALLRTSMMANRYQIKKSRYQLDRRANSNAVNIYEKTQQQQLEPESGHIVDDDVVIIQDSSIPHIPYDCE